MGKMRFTGLLTRLADRYGALMADRRGNAVIVFGLSAMVICAAAGGGIDFARVQTERSHIQDAADAAVLRATAMPRASEAEQKAAANHVFYTAFLGGQQSRAHVEITKTELARVTTGNRTDITYTTHALVTPLFLGLVGLGDGLPVTVVSKAQAQLRKSEIVLVLDTTGSMASDNRMTNLKSSIDTVLAGILSEKGTNTSGTKVAVVPFNTQVKIAPATNLSYIDYGQAKFLPDCAELSGYCQPVYDAFDKVCKNAGSQSACRQTAKLFTRKTGSGNNTYYYARAVAYENSGSNKYKIYTYDVTYRGTGFSSESNSNKTENNLNSYNSTPSGYSRQATPVYSDGYNKKDAYKQSVRINGSNRSIDMPAISANQGEWKGCISDREQPYDVSEASPTTGVSATRYPARACKNSGDSKLKPVMGLTEDIASVRAHVKSLQSDGNTNITIGVQWGMEVLSPNMPYSEGVNFRDEETLKYMILVTDGENTENRFTKTTKEIDARTKLACETARAQGITVFVVRVMEGNSALLRECASRPEYFYDLKSADQLGQALLDVFNTMKKTRLTQ